MTDDPYDVAARAAERALRHYSASNAPIGSATGDVVLALHSMTEDERMRLADYVSAAALRAVLETGLYQAVPARPAPKPTPPAPVASRALVLMTGPDGRPYPVGEVPHHIQVDRSLWEHPPADFVTVEGKLITFHTMSGPIAYEVIAVHEDGTRACYRAPLPDQPAIVLIDEAHRLPRVKVGRYVAEVHGHRHQAPGVDQLPTIEDARLCGDRVYIEPLPGPAAYAGPPEDGRDAGFLPDHGERAP